MIYAINGDDNKSIWLLDSNLTNELIGKLDIDETIRLRNMLDAYLIVLNEVKQ